MIYVHKKSGDKYRFLLEYWDTERQAVFVLYSQLETGNLFGRSKEVFDTNFELVANKQAQIKARPHPFIPDEPAEPEGGE